MGTLILSGYSGVMRMASALAGPERDLWLRAIRACYEISGNSGYETFAKRWLGGELRHIPISLKMLSKYGILEKVGESVRRRHRAYWRMPDRAGVAKALRELGYLQGAS